MCPTGMVASLGRVRGTKETGMNSYWIEQQARQHIDEIAADARGGQLARRSEASKRRWLITGRRPSLRPRAWLDAMVVRSRRPAARSR